MKNKIYLPLLILLLILAACSSKKEVVSEPFNPDTLEEVSQIQQLESTAQLIEAGKQKMLGNSSQALLLYAEAVKVDPRNSAAYYELAKLHAQQGFVEDAEEYAIKAVRLDPDNKFFSLLLADVYFLQSKNEKGFEVQNELARKFPTDMNIQISKLSTLLYLEKYDEAIAVFEHIENISGFNNELSLQKQRIFMEMNRPDLALQEARRLVSYFPGELVYLELLAELYRENDQPQEAYKVYHQMLEARPDYPMARLLLADYYTNAGEDEKAYDELRQAFMSPELGLDGKVRIMVSYYYLSEEDSTYLEQSYQLGEIMLKVHPDEAQAHAVYGDFLFRDERYEDAWEKYHAAALIDPSELGYWQQVLSIEARLQDYESMLNTSDKALEYFFEQPVIFFFNGLAHYQLENFEQAISSFRYGVDLAVSEPDLLGQLHTLLADTYHKLERYEESYNEYEKALEINPDDAYALNNYSYYMSLRNANLEKARQMSARSLELEPDNASFQDTFGWINYKMGDYENARIWIRKALDNSETPNAVVLEHYGDVLYKLGEKEEAQVYWKQALEHDQAEDDVEGVSEFLEQKVKEGTLIE